MNERKSLEVSLAEMEEEKQSWLKGFGGFHAGKSENFCSQSVSLS